MLQIIAKMLIPKASETKNNCIKYDDKMYNVIGVVDFLRFKISGFKTDKEIVYVV